MKKLVLMFALLSGFSFAADVTGVPNFHQVDDRLYRGAQPTEQGFQSLAKLGVKTVIDLRDPSDHGRSGEQKTVTAAGMNYIHLGLNGYHAPSPDQISRLLETIDTESGPVFIHCRRGADRTGTVIACYRIARQNWPNDKALAEAKQYGMSRTEISMQNFVRNFRTALTGIPAQVLPAAVAAQ
jgi:tyrosine-protein phosphatase SIW14